MAIVDKDVDKQGHAGRRAGLPRVPLFTRGAGDRCEALLPAAVGVGGEEIRRAVSEAEAVHAGSGVRRLAERAEGIFRGWRRVRPDLPAEPVALPPEHAGPKEDDDDPTQETNDPAGLRAVARLDAVLSVSDRADSAFGRGSQGVHAYVARILACGDVAASDGLLPAEFRRIADWCGHQSRVRHSCRVGAGALPLSGQAAARLARRFAFCFADGGGGHRAHRNLCSEWLARQAACCRWESMWRTRGSVW